MAARGLTTSVECAQGLTTAMTNTAELLAQRLACRNGRPGSERRRLASSGAAAAAAVAALASWEEERERGRKNGGQSRGAGRRPDQKARSERPWTPVAGVRLPCGGHRRGRGRRVRAPGGGAGLGRSGERSEREVAGPAAPVPFFLFLNFFFPKSLNAIF